MTARCCTPINDQRPKRWPCSADSSRNDGPVPCSLRYAATGVSQSSMKTCLTGISECSRATSRTSSSVGETSSSARSATAANELLHRVGGGQAARGEQDGEVVQDVGGLLRNAPVGLAAGGARDLV